MGQKTRKRAKAAYVDHAPKEEGSARADDGTLLSIDDEEPTTSFSVGGFEISGPVAGGCGVILFNGLFVLFLYGAIYPSGWRNSTAPAGPNSH